MNRWLQNRQAGPNGVARDSESRVAEPGGREATGTRGLSVRDLRVGYRGRDAVLDGVDLNVQPGRRLAFVGANGAGKTTLLRAVAGSVAATSGDVVVDGVALQRSRRGLERHRQLVQLVLQDPADQLFSADVFADVSFGPTNLGLPPDEVRRRVEETLDVLGISDLADRPVHQLSFGQQKRVAIAGAVAMRPAYLLLDEPTAGLDPAGVEALLASLTSLEERGTTIALSTHDLAFAWEWADDLALLHDGHLRQDAAHRVLSDEPALHAAALRAPWQAQMLARAGVTCAGAQTSRDGGADGAIDGGAVEAVNEVVGGDSGPGDTAGDTGPGDAGGEGPGARRRPVIGAMPRTIDEIYDAVVSGVSRSSDGTAQAE